ncbi:two-component sensor histidine kinase [Clostridium pasteurianum DSM 525 = ATCC 6013]|uniref:Signal transduction histidine kinase regulating citrate/malate metabolism n=1 Tax=Clostridium pasteurianum DSM 525 = ATCC 6013 TaxID=1262449 RepID=A0A0H3J636_CLOPA|nr:ATP-binding protein [Clostridium pasteurianum]AJA48632.1 two-component sensor histidine kinase [Clostridium pasteurianum DSM 525 = ATCC 6013]AJA52620.1 two-component sensor histidine kinase [Clostridium pasteurianum DSM 525 = ATCC 6013]AOZ75862.1 histidine kinase [Clostridium pasteurianum DSM 525 = ATCC 6013]AOZ79658.1 histidine kinase [Clostridium pasteurianum]ELP57890.1 two-component sensor histidine kinase [Clostridium pasteurianum DSM 525 = ATCC 6013]
MAIIMEILSDVIESLLFLGIFAALHNKKRFLIENKLRSILFCILFVSMTYFSTIYINNIYRILFITIFDILLLAYITRIKIFASIVIFFVFLSVLSVTEYFIGIIEMIILNINLNQIFLNFKYSLVFIIATKIMQVIIVLLLFRFSKYFNKFKLFQQEGILFSNLIMQIGVFALLILIINFSIFDVKDLKIYNCFIFIVYFIFLIIQLNGLKEYRRIVNVEAKYKIQEHQIKDMEEIIKIIRQEKHDFANHINVIWGLCSLNKPDTVEKIKNYVNGISNTLHSSFKYIDTGNDCLSGLLSIKSNYAVKNNINFDIMIDEPFSSIEIKENDLISIISNIIDNAFEAFEVKSNIENKEITIDSFSKDNKFFIEISNNGDMIPEDIQNKIFDRGFSTKTKKSQDHGFGLYIIKQLIEQNNGIISLESTLERTTFLIEFKMKEFR